MNEACKKTVSDRRQTIRYWKVRLLRKENWWGCRWHSFLKISDVLEDTLWLFCPWRSGCLAMTSLVIHHYCKGTHLRVISVQFSSFQSLSCVRLFETPWIAACQASLSIINSRSSLRLMSIESVMPSSHLILCCHLLLLPPIPPSIRVFSNDSTLCMRWPKYWSFSCSITPSKDQCG